MSSLEIDILRILRVFGPCSNAEVGRKLRIRPDKTYPVIARLTEKGYAIHPRLQRWDISELGRDWFERNGINNVRLFRAF